MYANFIVLELSDKQTQAIEKVSEALNRDNEEDDAIET